MLSFIKKTSFWAFTILLFLPLIGCQPKNQIVSYIVQLKPKMGPEKIAELFHPHEVISAKRSSRSSNQYTCQVKVKPSKRAKLMTAVESMVGVESIKMMKSKLDPPTNSTNDKMTKTKPIKS